MSGGGKVRILFDPILFGGVVESVSAAMAGVGLIAPCGLDVIAVGFLQQKKWKAGEREMALREHAAPKR